MKTKQNIFVLCTWYLVALSLCFAGCEVIREEDRLIPVSVAEECMRTHVLIEYTGFRCVNCPKAEATAQELQTLYGDRLVVVAMHPASNPFTQGAYDYTCPEADEVYLFMDGEEDTPFPTGNIDMQSQEDGYFSDQSEWPALLSRALTDTVCPYLAAEVTTVDTVRRTVRLTAYAYSTVLTDCRMAVWLTEDSIIGPQAMPDGTAEMEYCHRHVLRAAQGGQPFGSPVTLSQEMKRFELAMTYPEDCNPAHCHLVTLLLDNNNYHILQAYETQMAPIGSDDALCPTR